MDYRRLGDSDLTVSAICLGTMTYGQQNTEAEAHAQLDYALEHGISFVDTAEMYPVPPRPETCTLTETIVGSWLRHRRRDQVVLATKVAGPRRSMDWIRGGPGCLDRANIREALEGSLRRLQTDYVDLYQLHWPERNTPIFGEYRFDPVRERDAVPIRAQLEVLAEVVREGKVRYVGLSNETPWGVTEFLRLAREHGLPRVVSCRTPTACSTACTSTDWPRSGFARASACSPTRRSPSATSAASTSPIPSRREGSPCSRASVSATRNREWLRQWPPTPRWRGVMA